VKLRTATGGDGTCTAWCRVRHPHTFIPRRKAKVPASHLVVPIGYAAYAASPSLAFVVALGYVAFAVLEAYGVEL